MDVTGSPLALLKLMAPKTPLLFKTIAGHTLGTSDTSSQWTLKEEVTIKLIRSLLDESTPASSVSKAQRASLRDAGVKGKKWISKYTIPAPKKDGDNVAENVHRVVDELAEGGKPVAWEKPEVADLKVEWTGWRKDANAKDTLPDVSEGEKYGKLLEEVTSDIVVLYFHGGAHYLMSPASHRDLTAKLAKLTAGRTYSVEYRLAPQNPFPAAVVDAFVAYLSLLSPPEGAPHKPVEAKNIVFAGDSAGGNLSLALLQLLLHLHRTSTSGTPTVNFHGKTVEVPLPGGAALNSPWCDMSASMPSMQRFAKYDYLPTTSWDPDAYPADDIWPAKQPRLLLYTSNDFILHPLASPLAAQDWTGSPPVHFAYGQEVLRDEGAGLARRMHSQGVTVQWDEYEAMPHCSALVFPGSPVSNKTLDRWSAFIKKVVAGPVDTHATFFKARTFAESPLEIPQLLSDIEGVAEEEILPRQQKKRDEALKKWVEKQSKTAPGYVQTGPDPKL